MKAIKTFFKGGINMKAIKTLIYTLIVLLWSCTAWAGSQQTSSTLASTIITNARSLVNQGSSTFASDAEMLVWLNSGTLDIVSRTGCLEDVESITLTSGTSEYSLTNSYISVKHVIYINEDSVRKGLIRGDPTSAGHAFDVAEPAYYYEWDGKIGIYPVLDSVSGTTNELLNVYLIERPSSVASGVSVLVPAYYDKALTFYVAAQVELKDGQAERYAVLMTIYENELNRFRMDYSEKPKQRNDVVR